MIKTKTILVLLLVCTNYLQAQTSKFSLGVIGGPSYSFYYKENYSDFITYRLLYTVGLTAQTNLNRRVSLTTNLLFDQKGEILRNLKPQNGTSNSKVDFVITYNYITLPIMGTYSFGKNNRFSVSVGPYISYFFLEKYELKSDGNTISSNRVTSLDNPIEAGLCLNFGTNIPITDKLNLNISARNNMGLVSPRLDYNTVQLLFGASYAIKK
jgi:hypothetical protein